MAEYSKKTCNICGVRDIQPNMVRATKKVMSGKSTTGINGRTIAAAILMPDNKAAGRKLNQWLFANNKRNHFRYSEVWMCHDCAATNSVDKKEESDDPISPGTFIIVAGVVIFMLFYIMA